MAGDERTRRGVLGLVGSGALAGMGGCSLVIPEMGPESTVEEDWETVSPQPFTAVAKSRSPVARFGGPKWTQSFGAALATTGDTVFVGVPGADQGSVENVGAVAVFERAGGDWEQTTTLTGRGHERGGFGKQVAADGSTLLVGNEYGYSGQPPIPVSVFERSSSDGWQLTTELTDPVYVDSMAIDGDTAVMKTESGDSHATVFERQDGAWDQQATLRIDPLDDGRTVRRVGKDGETILIGAPPKSGPKSRRAKAGVVHVFERSAGGWHHQTALSGAPGTDHFGWSVSVDGGRAVIGDYINDTAYVFSSAGGEWTREQMYTATGGGGHQYFGDTVTIDGETVLVAAYNAQFGDSGGAVYQLDTDTGAAEPDGTYYTAPDPSRQLGHVIATTDGTTVLTGTHAEEQAVYIYEH
ncbi:hypothetical protein Huta_2094 [Halorhabdus utahensis DSM 12940]|uniref:PKD domain-containing protein n=1 Tax=Halorhabdus utahensis (strain DSM 12940 / JCM 11049 / AX-2) TaxID=519442 RepID=C7NU16_HALUD|nr:hypothetical protein [Halorhabdus utahensis]ACV12261.1 hypothetical protein Huta_2094 [Halorhabdus utahensis DSM 12940]